MLIPRGYLQLFVFSAIRPLLVRSSGSAAKYPQFGRDYVEVGLGAGGQAVRHRHESTDPDGWGTRHRHQDSEQRRAQREVEIEARAERDFRMNRRMDGQELQPSSLAAHERPLRTDEFIVEEADGASGAEIQRPRWLERAKRFRWALRDAAAVDDDYTEHAIARSREHALRPPLASAGGLLEEAAHVSDEASLVGRTATKQVADASVHEEIQEASARLAARVERSAEDAKKAAADYEAIRDVMLQSLGDLDAATVKLKAQVPKEQFDKVEALKKLATGTVLDAVKNSSKTEAASPSTA